MNINRGYKENNDQGRLCPSQETNRAASKNDI